MGDLICLEHWLPYLPSSSKSLCASRPLPSPSRARKNTCWKGLGGGGPPAIKSSRGVFTDYSGPIDRKYCSPFCLRELTQQFSNPLLVFGDTRLLLRSCVGAEQALVLLLTLRSRTGQIFRTRLSWTSLLMSEISYLGIV